MEGLSCLHLVGEKLFKLKPGGKAEVHPGGREEGMESGSGRENSLVGRGRCWERELPRRPVELKHGDGDREAGGWPLIENDKRLDLKYK